MGHYDDSPEEQEARYQAHVNYDHANPPQNSRIPAMVQHVNDLFEVMKLRWYPDEFVFRNALGFECTAELLYDLCGIMGIDPYEELPRILLEDAFKKV